MKHRNKLVLGVMIVLSLACSETKAPETAAEKPGAAQPATSGTTPVAADAPAPPEGLKILAVKKPAPSPTATPLMIGCDSVPVGTLVTGSSQGEESLALCVGNLASPGFDSLGTLKGKTQFGKPLTSGHFGMMTYREGGKEHYVAVHLRLGDGVLDFACYTSFRGENFLVKGGAQIDDANSIARFRAGAGGGLCSARDGARDGAFTRDEFTKVRVILPSGKGADFDLTRIQ